MKKIFVAAILLGSLKSIAQSTPATVKSAFTKKFPGVTVKKWDAEDGKYEANFTQGGKTMSATFSAAGAWEETETDIKVTELPAAVTSYVKANYKGKKIKEAAILSSPDAAKMYEAAISGTDLMFDENGKFVKAVKAAAEAKEGKEEKD